MRPLFRGLLWVAFTLSAVPLSAELPPYVYDELKAEAGEHLEITPTKITTNVTQNDHALTVRIEAVATVKKVLRSASGLGVNQEITLRYQTLVHKEPLVGPSEPRQIRVGETYVAYLDQDAADATYKIAARGYSFERIDP